MDFETKEVRKKAIWKGVFIGGGIMLGIGILAVGAVAGFFLKTIGKYFSDNEMNVKINQLIQCIDEEYLYEYDKEEMENAIYDAIFESLGDPYAGYYTAEEFKELMADSEGTYCGIGVVVQYDEEEGYLRVVEPYEGAPGEEAGIMADDYIIAIDGCDIYGMDADLAVNKIRGEEGTQVSITLRRDDKELTVDVTRRIVTVITVAHEMLENKIGYIQIAQFDVATVKQVEEAINELKEQGMTSLIVDVRDNPGGRLDSVVNIVDFFVEKDELVVYTQDKKGNRRDYKALHNDKLDVPCVVLVNGNSASASEVFAGAMQDYEIAHIMGTQSFGKGIVQSIIPLTDGTAFKITVEDYYTPNGNNIHEIGITPDTVVEFDKDAYLNEEKDTQLEAAIEYLTK